MKPGLTSAETSPSCRADDAWLQRWLPLLRERTGERCVLELGCGKGRDTAVLQAAGLRVDGWQIAALEEQTIDRYERPKVVWELIAVAS